MKTEANEAGCGGRGVDRIAHEVAFWTRVDNTEQACTKRQCCHGKRRIHRAVLE
jgi:hypothetical protein